MRASLIPTLALLVALTLTGCSAASGASLPGLLGGNSAASQPAATAPPAPGPAATTAPAATPVTAASPTASSAEARATAAIQAVIQRANQEQQDAFAKDDPTIMRDTATSSYYDELVQINADMRSAGVSAIKLVNLEWGPITLTSPTTAQATTYETWLTTNSDGSTDQSRDRNDYTLVQEQGVWKIQTDDHPDSGTGQPNGQPVGPTAPAPSRPVAPTSPSPASPTTSPIPASDADVSHNWSGYAATGGKFTAVTGTWKVPEPSSSGGFGSGATWVGIGGVNTRDLIQAGTQETTDGSGAVHYQAWTETLPQASRQVPFTVSPGDSVTVSIEQQAAGQWLVSFKNNTTGKSYQTTLRYASSLSSAEWVEEAPSARRGIVPLDNFGTVHFSGGSAVKDGKTVTIAQAGAQPITMADSRGRAIAVPSALTADGQGFSVSRAVSAAPLDSPAPSAWPGRQRSGY